MANHDISKDNFNLELRKLQTNDKAHADTFNPLFETLINNDAALKEDVGEVEDKLTDLGSKQTNLGKKQGDLDTLKTTNKDNLVGALNELFTTNSTITDSVTNKKYKFGMENGAIFVEEVK